MKSEIIKSFTYYYEKQKKIKLQKFLTIIIPIIVMLLSLVIQNPSILGAPEGSEPAPLIVSVIIFSLGVLLGVVSFFEIRKIEWNINNAKIAFYTNQLALALDNQITLVYFDTIESIKVETVREKNRTPFGSISVSRNYIIINTNDTNSVSYLLECFPESLDFMSDYAPVKDKILHSEKK